MDKITHAKMVLEHLGVKPNSLSKFLFNDKAKEYPLEYDEDRILAHYNEDSLWSIKTVRFLKDFGIYGSGVHLNTTNKSFLRSAELFRALGIKNNHFHLQINNPLIMDLDPWSEDLTDEQRFMIMQECNENVWYILREIIKIDGRRFIGNRAVLSFIWCCLTHINTTIILPRQSGKDLDDDALIKTPTGWIRHGEAQVGDQVLAWDNTVSTITGVYPQGSKSLYNVKFEDGRFVPAGLEHSWGVNESGIFRVQTTEELLSKNLDTLSIPLPVFIDKDLGNKILPLDPYLIGVLITDNNLKHGHCSETIANYLGNIIPKDYEMVNGQKQWEIRKSVNFDYRTNFDLDSLLARFGLGGRSFNKFIPEIYLNGSYNQRLRALQGVLDISGRITKDMSIKMNTINPALVKDVLYLARSIGCIAKQEYVVSNGLKQYAITIKHRLPGSLFLNSNYSFETRINEKFDGYLRFKSIEKTENRNSTCIEIDHPDHLYITDDFIVTHNTVGMQVLIFILQYIIGRGYKSGLITLASSNRQQFVNAVKKIRSGVPDYLIRMSYKDKDSGNLLTYEGFGEDNKNIFEVKVPSGGKDGAENVARGNSFGVLLRDEPAWMKYIENIITGSGPASLTEQRNMAEQGRIWFTAGATTPNSTLKEEGEYMYNYVKGACQWREAYFDCFGESSLYETIVKNSPSGSKFPTVTIQFNHLQLGLGHDWVQETMDKLKITWAKAKIDLLLMWTEEGKNKVFDDKTRSRLNELKFPTLYSQSINETNLYIDWFLKINEIEEFVNKDGEHFGIGVDTSDALGEGTDSCTVTIRRFRTGEVIAVGRYSLAYIGDVREVIEELLIRFNNTLLIIERNRAQQIIDDLLVSLPSKGIDPFERIYNDIYQYPVKYSKEFAEVKATRFSNRTRDFYLKFKGKFGFRTGGQSRQELYGLIYEAVANTGSGLRYDLLINELVALETDSSGRIDHDDKHHDDIVISWLLTYWFIVRGQNKELYGIKPNTCLIEVRPLMEDPTKAKFTEEQLLEFAKIKERISELSNELLNTDSELLAPRLEMEIRRLAALIPKELKRIVTIDELLEHAKAERMKRMMEKKKKGFNSWFKK